tara:strand:- start:1392 stop:1583 length:192 start_codon:yes stop_codon:yes gene_type:complete
VRRFIRFGQWAFVFLFFYAELAGIHRHDGIARLTGKALNGIEKRLIYYRHIHSLLAEPVESIY